MTEPREKPVLIVTGGSRGIGAATAKLAAAQGWCVMTTYLAQAAAATAIVEEIRTSRSLQYGFRKYFGCRPFEWLRNERLILAKTKLTNSNDSMNITTLVYDLGFPSASLFSKYYKEKFGEKPSETLSRKKNRIAANAM